MVTGASLHRVEPGSKVQLAKIDPGDTSAGPGDKVAVEAALVPLRARLAALQAQLYAGAHHRLLVVLQGLDTSGKGGTVNHVLGAGHPVGLRVVSFKAPTRDELARDYLWRIHANVPKDGEIGVFDRSHYEDVLVARVEELVPESRWRQRYDHINAFERMLTDEGTTIVKVLLHISKDEQRERLQARLDDPAKRWKFQPDDLHTRSLWDDYQAAFAEAVERTSTHHAPWHVVPANHKWYRNWAVATIVVAVLEGIDMSWPEPDGLDSIVID